MKSYSIQSRKQRKVRYNAPLHVRQKYMHVHLSPELRKKYGVRNIMLKKGDKVKILRGQFKKKEVAVDRIDLKREKVYLNEVEFIKKDGSKTPYPLNPSNLMITTLNLSDKKRKAKLELKSKQGTSKVSKEITKEAPKQAVKENIKIKTEDNKNKPEGLGDKK